MPYLLISAGYKIAMYSIFYLFSQTIFLAKVREYFTVSL